MNTRPGKLRLTNTRRTPRMTQLGGWERRLEVVAAPTGEAARFLAATAGEGSAWLTREEVVALIGFFERWLARTDKSA